MSHAATESRPVYSPDGRSVAFTSTRTGNGDVYVLDITSRSIKRLTFTDDVERMDNWSRDGKYIYFSTSPGDISGMKDVYRVAAEGGTPMLFSADRFASEYHAAPSASRRCHGYQRHMSSQWWRKGHSHMDETEIWLIRDGTRVRAGDERRSEGTMAHVVGRFSEDLLRLRSQRRGEHLGEAAGGTARQVTKFTDGRMLWPGISQDGKTIVFERDFGIWEFDTLQFRENFPVAIHIAGHALGCFFRTSEPDVAIPSSLAIAGWQKDRIHGARRFICCLCQRRWDGYTDDQYSVSRIAPRLGFGQPSHRLHLHCNGHGQIYFYDIWFRLEGAVYSDALADQSPRWSHDGKLLAFIRDGRELRVLLRRKTRAVVTAARFRRPPSR